MQKKKRNWLISGVIAIGISSIIVGTILGTQLSHNDTNNYSSSFNANSSTNHQNQASVTTSNIKQNHVTSETKNLLPTLLANDDGYYKKVNDNQVSLESNTGYYLNPNLSSATNQPITFIWYGSSGNENYGGVKIGTSSSTINQGYFQLSAYDLNQYSYYYFTAQITNNGTIIKSQTSNTIQVKVNNPITISGLTLELNGQKTTTISSEFQLPTSDAFDLVANATVAKGTTNITYTWYASTKSGTNLTQLEDANDVTTLGSGSSNSFALNQDVINAKFTNFFVKVSATINNQTYSQTGQTSLSYDSNNEITNASISISSSTIYIGQQDNYPFLTVSYKITSALEGQSYQIQFYGKNPYVNEVATTGIDLVGTKSGLTSSTNLNGSVTLQLSTDSAFYSEYYAVITIGNYTYTTTPVSQSIQKVYNSSNNNSPSIINKNANQTMQKLNNVVNYIQNNQTSLFSDLLANNCVAFSNKSPIYEANFASTIEAWLKKNQQLNGASIVVNNGIITATINKVTSSQSYSFAFANYFELIQNAINDIVDFTSGLTDQSNLVNWLINTRNLEAIDHKYQLSNLATYLNFIKSLAKYPLSLNLNYTSGNWSFSKVTTSNSQISFTFNYLGVNGTKVITITMTQLNTAIANEAVNYMQNHDREIIDATMMYDWGSFSNGGFMFNSFFPTTLKIWLDNHFFQAPYSIKQVAASTGPQVYVSVGNQTATNYFTFPLTQLIKTVRSALTDLSLLTNDLNNTPNSISNWLLATNNLVYEYNQWVVKNVYGYFKQTLIRNLIPTLQTKSQYENLYQGIYLLFNSIWDINIDQQSVSGNTINFVYSYYGISSIDPCSIPVPSGTVTNQTEANDVINYISQNQTAFLNMLIQNGLVTYQNDQVQFAANFNLAVAGWISANDNAFLNLDIVNNNGVISAQVNSISSTNTYTFPTALYQSKLQTIANLLADLVNNKSNSFVNWVNNNYFQLVTIKNVVEGDLVIPTYTLTNLSSYLATLNLSTIGNYTLPLFSSQIYQFTNVSQTSSTISFNVSFAGVNSSSLINIQNLDNSNANVNMLNSIVTYLDNHQDYLYKFIAYYKGIIIKNNQATLSSNFNNLLTDFINDNIPATDLDNISAVDNNGVVTIGNLVDANFYLASKTFKFSITKYQEFLQSQVNQVASYINSLNNTQLAINQWLIATDNASYQNGKWTFNNLSTYLNTLLESSNLFNYFYPDYQFANIEQENNQVSFVIDLNGFISNILVKTTLSPADLTTQGQVNNVINYLTNHENELLAGLIGNGGFNAVNDQIVINDNMLNAIRNWLVNFYNSYTNVKLIAKGSIIYAELNNVTSTIGYQFPTSKLTTILQKAANQLALNIKSSYLSSLESWLLSNGDLTQNNGVWTLSNLGSFLVSQRVTSQGIKNGTYTYPMPYNFTNQNCTFSNVTVANNNITFTISIYGINSTMQLQIPVPSNN